ncbi:hypothetical protein ACFQX8_08945 [Klenkia terrae]|uniref:hypothetical protein n=1 Tax=Klenkia terrae TaxID=1052259 RepID=UPI00361579BF
MTTRETLSGPARELMRRAAEQLLDPAATWAEDLHAAALSGELMRPITEDPVLAAGTRRANLSNLRHWAAATVADPGGRVPPNTGAEMLETSRDMVRRGLDARGLDAFRRGQDVAWRRWMDVCFGLTDDPQLLREVLEVSAVSVTAFVEDTLAAVMAQMAREHVELTHGASADRRATVTLLLEGAPIPLARAEARLGYGLSGAHTAAVVWAVGADARPAQVEAVAEAVARAAGVTRRLTVVASAASSWLWLPTDVLPGPPTWPRRWRPPPASRSPWAGRAAGSRASGAAIWTPPRRSGCWPGRAWGSSWPPTTTSSSPPCSPGRGRRSRNSSPTPWAGCCTPTRTPRPPC